MKKISAIIVKELNSYFKSPMAYIILFITTTVFNVFFFIIIDQNREASLRDMFKLMEFMFVFIVPLLTMKLFAQERQSGTFEFLLTCPVKHSEIILGKYLGSFIFFFLMTSVSVVYYLIINFFGQPDFGQALIGYLGILLEGALFISIGMMASSWTKNQIIAAITSYLILLLAYFTISFLKYFDPKWSDIIRSVSFWSHAENFSSGLITVADVVYYVSGIAFFLTLTRWGIDKSR